MRDTIHFRVTIIQTKKCQVCCMPNDANECFFVACYPVVNYHCLSERVYKNPSGHTELGHLLSIFGGRVQREGVLRVCL